MQIWHKACFRAGCCLLVLLAVSAAVGRDLDARTRDFLDALSAAGEVAGQSPTVLDWPSLQALLVDWEAAPAGDAALASYSGLLEAVAASLRGGACSISATEETEYQAFLQRALTLRLNDSMRAALLLALVESRLRTEPWQADFLLRMESLLLEALDLAAGGQGRADILARLGAIALAMARAEDTTEIRSIRSSNHTRATEYFRELMGMAGSVAIQTAVVQECLNWLLRPDGFWQSSQRFQPLTELRVPLYTRNLDRVDIELRNHTGDLIRSGEQRIHSVPIARNDWQLNVVSFGDQLVPGTYTVRAQAGSWSTEASILVGTAELMAVEHRDRSLSIWALDASNGQPIRSATVELRDTAGNGLLKEELPANGWLEIPAEVASGWQSVRLVTGQQVYDLQRGDPGSLPEYRLDWLFTPGPVVQAGQTLRWLVHHGGEPPRGNNLGRLRLPDGSSLLPQLEDVDSWVAGLSVAIQAASPQGGPLRWELPGRAPQVIGHLQTPQSNSFPVHLQGERLNPGISLYSVQQPLQLILDADLVSRIPPAQGFLRLAVFLESSPAGSAGDGTEAGSGRLNVLERIIPATADTPAELTLDLSRFLTGAAVDVFSMELSDLDGRTALWQKTFALSRFVGEARLQADHRIAEAGQAVRLELSLRDWRGRGADPLRRGQLIVHRETWESRYVHRRKGTVISEEAYFNLPERSLLGVARTDYLLSEEGFVREEVQRFDWLPPIDGSTSFFTFVPDRAGLYAVELVHDEVTLSRPAANAPLLIHVIAESGDLRMFRPDQLRMVIEPSADYRSWDLLVLGNRQSASVLILESLADGSHAWHQVPYSGPGLVWRRPSPAPQTVRQIAAFVVGDLATVLLRQALVGERDAMVTDLNAEFPASGPGMPYVLPVPVDTLPNGASLRQSVQPQGVAVTWNDTIFNRMASRLAEDFAGAGVSLLSEQLPIFQPVLPYLAGEHSGTVQQGNSPPALFVMADVLLRHPAVWDNPPVRHGSWPPLRVDPADGNVLATGTLPNHPGLWDWLLLVTGRDLCSIGRLPFSTDLPLVVGLHAPAVSRVGDHVILVVDLENRGPHPVSPMLQFSVPDFLELSEPLTTAFSLPPGESLRMGLLGSVRAAGKGELSVVVTDAGAERAGVVASAQSQLTAIEPVAAVRRRFVRAAIGSAADRVEWDGADWRSGELIITDSLAALVRVLWEDLRLQLPVQDQPIRTWLDAVFATSSTTPAGEAAGRGDAFGEFQALLLDRVAAGVGGWAPRAGLPADPAFSAVFLYWLQEQAAANAAPAVPIPDGLPAYLEDILMNRQSPPMIRLMALAALPARNPFPAIARPSRLQARVFLEFFDERNQLGPVELALLLETARLFGFQQELEPLARLLNERQNSVEDLFGLSILYSAVFDLPGMAALSDRLERRLAEGLTRMESTPSWSDLLALVRIHTAFERYHWLPQRPAPAVNLFNLPWLSAESFADAAPAPRFQLAELAAGNDRIGMQLAGPENSRPLWFFFSGLAAPEPLRLPLFQYSTSFTRIFQQETLLQGTQWRRLPLHDQLVLEVGDQLQVELGFSLRSPEALLELVLPVPAGLRAKADSLRFIRTDSPEPLAVTTAESLGPEDAADIRLYAFDVEAGDYSLTIDLIAESAAFTAWQPLTVRNPAVGRTRAPESAAALPLHIFP